jgi:hypothetical protein
MAAAFADMMTCMVVANWFCLLNVYIDNLCLFLLLLWINWCQSDCSIIAGCGYSTMLKSARDHFANDSTAKITEHTSHSLGLIIGLQGSTY